MIAVIELVELGRSIRHSKQLKTKQPLAKMIVVAHNGNVKKNTFYF